MTSKLVPRLPTGPMARAGHEAQVAGKGYMRIWQAMHDAFDDAGRVADHEAAFKEGWDLAHEPAKCGHARANYKDPEYGTPDYQGFEECEFCAAQSRIERLQARVADDAAVMRDTARVLELHFPTSKPLVDRLRAEAGGRTTNARDQRREQLLRECIGWLESKTAIKSMRALAARIRAELGG